MGPSIAKKIENEKSFLLAIDIVALYISKNLSSLEGTNQSKEKCAQVVEITVTYIDI